MMDTSHGNHEDYSVALYEASLDGSVSTLDTLLQRDRLILHKLSLTSFTETPLHIAALLGHLQFTNALLRRKPQLVEKVDSSGRTALHLACAEGHTQVVKALLLANMDMCLVSDQEERIPLHLAAMRGHVEVIKELLTAHPRSISRVNLYGDNVLHLCVRYNCLDALKLFVEYSVNDEDFVNSKDNDGNSILHLAVMLGQTETIKYLLSVSKIKGEANAINRIGNTALDVLELGHRDFKSPKIQDMLMAAGVRRSKDLNSLDLLPTTQREPARYINIEGQPAPAAQSRFKKWWAYFCLCGWFKHFKRHPSDMIVEARGTLMLVATVIATVTFQTGINPPGGVWQNDGKYNNRNYTTGSAVLSDINPDAYKFLLYFNTTSLVAALSVVLLVTIGISRRSKLFVWLLTLAMLIAVTFMLLTYFWAAFLVTSDAVLENISETSLLLILGIWDVVLLIAGVVLIYRLIVLLVKLLLKCIRCLTMSPTN